MIKVSMASFSGRTATIAKALESLQNQTLKPDLIQVYLNDYISLSTEEVEYLHGRDLGDAGKFVDPVEGYNLTVDDDIIYPVDYVEKMVETCSMVGNYPVGVHCAEMVNPVKNYYKDRKVFHFTSKSPLRKVNVIGTGTLCYHSSKVTFTEKDCSTVNMGDNWFALYCQKNKIPMFCVSRESFWLKPVVCPDSIWSSRGEGGVQTSIMNRIDKWVLH